MKRIAANVFKYGFLWGYALLSLGLFAWVLISSFKSNREIFRSPFALPEALNFDNYIRAWSSASIGDYFWNSLVVSVFGTLFTVVFGAMTAYIIARLPFRGSAWLWALFAIGLAVPMQSLLLPTFLKMNELGLRDNLISLVIVYSVFGFPRAIFLLVAFMRTIPKEMEEAAIMDGCGYWKSFYKIILPLSMPGIATLAILDFIGAWNEYVYASVLITSDVWRTLPIGLANFRGEYSSEYGLISAGILYTMIPVVIIYIIFQEQIVKGLAAGSVKG
ncbi:carbohydrate ABC transporter permease [Paenibacillus sp. strain BS8-2]